MGKVKIKLINGVIEEKNVISSFKVGLDSFLIIDSESTGSMGLPIILVSKLVENKLTKVIDQNEWQKTKEYLKLIISNAEMEYVNEAIEYNADEIYFTQLTLPQASFDAIKNNYKPAEKIVNIESPVEQEEVFVPNIEITPINEVVTPMVETPVVPIMPDVIPTIPVVPEIIPVVPVIEPIAPIEPIIPVTPIVETVVPTISMPEVMNTHVEAPVVSTIKEITPVVPETIVSQPVISEVATNINSSEDKYKDMKETFMKSCENMFDALVNQIENKN